MITYDESKTTGHQAAARCGLRIKRSGNSMTSVVLVDATGSAVFEGQRDPESWKFLREERGLTYGPH